MRSNVLALMVELEYNVNRESQCLAYSLTLPLQSCLISGKSFNPIPNSTLGSWF